MIATYFLWFFLYSVVGWVYETILCSVEQRKFVNRGFLNGPYCPIYGCGGLLVILLFGRMTNPLALFLSSAVVTCTLEYITSYVMEKLFHARWWDYSDWAFNLNGRVCLLGAVAFGGMSTLTVLVIHPRVAALIARIPGNVQVISAAVLFAGMVLDCVSTVLSLSDFRKKLEETEKKIAEKRALAKEKLRESDLLLLLREHQEDLARRISRQQHRILLAFPHLKHHRHDELLTELRKALNERRNGKKAGR